jgi:5-methylcytosine-specific restriction enzyme A
MPRLTTLKTALQRAPQKVRTQLSGDERIRGSTLQAIRQRILTRDCGLCQCERCRATGAARIATLVDHIVPLWAGGRESDANRQSINAECHELKSAAEALQRARGG